jgi:ligand-binding SRPBCC domain-containing protein
MSVRFGCTTFIRAPSERVFDAALDLDLHASSMAGSAERAIAGTTSGVIGLGEQVTWRARHFGVTWTMTSRIVELHRPERFVDEQLHGPFSRFRHTHLFRSERDGTEMRDVVEFSAPLGLLGTAAERVFLTRYMRRLIEERNRYLERHVTRR